jgi:hypothetical protein
MSKVYRRAQSSGAGAIAGAGYIGSITLMSGAAEAFVDLRDATATDGTVYIHEVKCPANEMVSVSFNGAVDVLNGVWVQSFTGADSVLYVEMI